MSNILWFKNLCKCVFVGFVVVFVVVVVFFYSSFVSIFCLYHVIFVFRSSLIDSRNEGKIAFESQRTLLSIFLFFFLPKVMQNYDGILTIKICACTLQNPVSCQAYRICLDYFNGNIHSNDYVDGTCLFLSQDPDV